MILRRYRWAAAHPLPWLLALYLPLAVLFGLIVPPYEGPDEIGHILYVKHIAERRGIPVQSRMYAVSYGFGQEGSQTPLYYALNAGLVRALGLGFAGLDGLPAANPFSTCGRPTGYNVAGYLHDPRLEQFPYRGAARTIHVMRLFSAFLGGVTIAAVYLAARFAFPHTKGTPALAAALVGLNPVFVFMGGVVNNDNLVNSFMAVAVALALYSLRRGASWLRTALLGALCGLAVLAKLGGLMALAFAGLCLLVGQWRRPGRLVAHGAVLAAAFLALAGWWFVRCWRLYGDPTGTNVMLSIYGGRRGWPAHLVVPELIETFRSYWGLFACGLRLPEPITWVCALLTALAIAGLVRSWRGMARDSRTAAGLLLAWLALIFVSWVRWNQITYAPLGRLWFQANAALGPLLGLGLLAWTGRRRWPVAVLAGSLWALALAGALLVVRPAFAMPPRYRAASAPAPAQVLPDARFGSSVRMVGYEMGARSIEPGQALDVALYLQATQPLTGDYALALQLISPAAGDNSVLVNYNTIPGRGSYPTFAWQPDEVIVDRYRLQIPAQVARAQAWRLVAILYDRSTGKRLPVSVAGQTAGELLGLGLVRVGASGEPSVPLEARLEPAPVAGDAIRLDGLTLQPEGGTLHVRVWWRALASPSADFTAMVHLYDATGAQLATGDGPPLGGAFPTSLWQPGDLIEDTYTLDLQDSAYAVGLGWYDQASGVRLPLWAAGKRIADDVYLAVVGRTDGN